MPERVVPLRDMVIIVNVRILLAVLGVAVSLTCGCNKGRNLQNPEAVRKGVMEYLGSHAGLNLNAMDVEVSSVNFRENEADALVSIKAKGSTDPASAMKMPYTLERKDDKWVVKKGAGKGAAAGHGEGRGMPGGAGAMGGMGGGEMPPAHPAVPPGEATGTKK
jgi:hypothetical protein